MLTITFEQAIPGLLDREGGRSDDPHDSGKATKYGISLAFLEDNKIDLTGDGIIDERDIETLTLDQAKAIYKEHFWDWLKCEDLPGTLALMVFDFGVNAGRYRAARFLQVAVRKAQIYYGHIKQEELIKIDGIIGPKTLFYADALFIRGESELLAGFMSKILFHYPSCKTWWKHGAGWIRRWGKTMAEVAEGHKRYRSGA